MAQEQFPKISTPFLNLRSDYGFKRTFGTPEFQANVVKLLEAALGDEINVKKIVPHSEGSARTLNRYITYHDKELLPADPDGKRILYDVYFTLKTEKGESVFKPRHILKDKRELDVEHHFILEMQNVYTPPYEDRMTFYASKMIAGQGKAGWNYDLDPVILIGITNFDFPYLTKQLVQEFELREKRTGESLTKKLKLLFYSLNQVPEGWDDCETELQRRLFLIKNMDKMDRNSKPFKDGGYKELFDAAESSNIVGEEAVLYSQSLSRLQEIENGFVFQYEEGEKEGRKRGREEGRKEGRKEGREEEKKETARKLKAADCDIDFISQITGLSKELIENL